MRVVSRCAASRAEVPILGAVYGILVLQAIKLI